MVPQSGGDAVKHVSWGRCDSIDAMRFYENQKSQRLNDRDKAAASTVQKVFDNKEFSIGWGAGRLHRMTAGSMTAAD